MKTQKLNCLIYIALLSALSLQVQAQPVQWTVEQGGNGHWYQAVATCPNVVGVTWPQAEAYARQYGTYLVTITSNEENQFVFNLSKDIKYWVWPEPTSGNNIGPWLGGHQDPDAVEPTGSWKWVNDEGYFMSINGNAIAYTNWHPGEPNNGIDQENALGFFGVGPNFNPTPKWNDFPEAGRTLAGQYYVPKGFIVEKDTVFNALPDWCGQDTGTPLACQGFEPPMDNGSVTVKKNRVLPLKATLLDDSVPVTNLNLVALPVIQVLYDSGTGDATDVTAQSLPAGQGTEGNEFEFDGTWWHFNLKTRNYTAPGTYTVSMVSGEATEYVVDPTCIARFVIE